MERLNFNVQIKDVEKINPLFSKCKIYICYTDLNRNNSDIAKNVIDDAIYSLYGCPIVGEFSKTKDDFLDHGGAIEKDENGDYQYVNTTIPYGYINENSEVNWEFVDDKEYLTVTGYLWTSRYPEALKAIEEGRPQSMEIEEVIGEFDDKKKFIISSFVFSGLCILGNDVEPCFEDAKIVAYSLDKAKFKREFTQMIRELKFSLSIDHQNESISTKKDLQKGGNAMLEKVKEMLQKYNLTIEDVSAKEIKYEDFSSVEELEEKVKEVFTSPKTQFSLTSEQLEDELRRELAEIETITEDWWGEVYKYPRYCYVDNKIDQNIVIARDCVNRHIVGFTFTLTNDNVEIDASSVARYKIDYNPMNLSGDTDDPEAMDDGGVGAMVDDMLDYALKRKQAEMKQQFTSEKENFTSKLDAKTKELSEKEDAILALDTKFQAIEQESKAKDATIEDLTKFKKQHEEAERKEKVEALFSKFSKHLSKEELEAFRKQESSFASYELFEKEIKSFTCDRLVESVKDAKTEFSQMALVDNLHDNKSEPDQPKDVWSRLSK